MSANSEPSQQAPPSSSMGQVRFLTVAEVAKLMRVSKMTVYRLVHAGELPAARVGRSFRVAEKDVHKYLESAYYNAG
ncbi:helix-turn-helix domain-containing protein [Saccharopolyspora rosea]|uniref:Helix-turn-helix domain-containing protein n=1 Tax=Saccharopolyspora rosea TaxID=524884 RepID=A0ABW3FKA4_9PSEU|nr:helix-turn-helix domain-containing protein [Saccharopolyspora rosea]